MSTSTTVRDPFDVALTEERIEYLVSVANRAIAMGHSAPLALAALETHLVNGLRALLAEPTAPQGEGMRPR